jgi:hypothetical protein
MKKLKFIGVFVLGLALYSCENAYDITQDGEFTEEATFKNVGDLQAWLLETYDRATVSSEIAYSAFLTDEASIGSQNAGQDLETYKFVVNNQDGNADAIWLGNYTLINYANRLMRGAEGITPSADVLPDSNNPTITEVALYNSIIAQAKALRAYGHFQLLAAFSEDIKNDASKGVIVMDHVPSVSDELPRNTTGEVFAMIEADLAAAEADLIEPSTISPASLLPAIPAGSAYKYISRNFINALRARMYTYRGNYVLAEQYADQVIADATATGMTLTPAGTYTNSSTFYNPASTTSPYRKMWADASQGEILFGLSRPVGKEAIAGLFYFNQTKISGGPFHDMGRNLFNLLADQNRDGSCFKPDNCSGTGRP